MTLTKLTVYSIAINSKYTPHQHHNTYNAILIDFTFGINKLMLKHNHKLCQKITIFMK